MQCQKSVTDFVSDAFIAAQEVGFDNLCEVVDGTPHGIDTLVRHMREMVFSLTEHESKELFRQYCRTGGPLSRNSMSRDEDVVGRYWYSWTP